MKIRRSSHLFIIGLSTACVLGIEVGSRESALAQEGAPQLRGTATAQAADKAASPEKSDRILKGGLFQRGSLNNLQTVDVENIQTTTKFLKCLAKQKTTHLSPFQNPFSVTIDKSHFMGEPLIAKLAKSENNAGTKDIDPKVDIKPESNSYDYYLVIFNFNVPAVKYSIVPTNYGFARFSFNLQVFSPPGAEAKSSSTSAAKIAKLYVADGHKFKSPSVQAAVGANAIWPARVISIYPVNEVLTVSREDTNQFEAQFKPEFQGGAAGSLTYTKILKDNFAFDLPKVIGTGSSAGTVTWTYYPAKAQPLMLGSKTTMAIIGVPSGLNYRNLGLRVLARFDYQLTKAKLPMWWGQSVYDAKEVAMDKVPSLKEITALHAVDLPREIRTTVSEVFKADVKEKPKLVLQKGRDRDYLVDPDSGAVYVPNGGSWKSIEFEPPREQKQLSAAENE